MVLAENPERVIKSNTASGFNPFLAADKMLIGSSKYLMYLVISPEDFRLRETVLMTVKVETFFHLQYKFFPLKPEDKTEGKALA